MLTAPSQEKLITGEELDQLTNIGPCELIDGRIVPMSPTSVAHAIIEIRIASALENFVRAHKLGKVLVGEAGLYTRRNPDRVRAADALFISTARYDERKRLQWYLDVAPELIVEILSPDDTMMEMMQKPDEYFSIGVELVWVLHPEAQSVFAYRSLTDVREFKQNDLLPGDSLLPGFTTSVKDLFEA
jgi:Uma2 family endonuclease